MWPAENRSVQVRGWRPCNYEARWCGRIVQVAHGGSWRYANVAGHRSWPLFVASHLSQLTLQVLDGAPPAARGGHSMAAIGNAIVLCGGTDRRLSECGHVHLLDFGGVNSLCAFWGLCCRMVIVNKGGMQRRVTAANVHSWRPYRMESTAPQPALSFISTKSCL